MTTPSQQDPSLTWGVLSFVGPGDSEATFQIEAMAETHFGDPVPVIETLPSLLVDGALAATTRWENREIVIRLRISANDGEALAEAEAALFQQRLLDQPPPLVWTSPVGLSAPAVFDVVAADLRRDNSTGWDLKEKLSGHRHYELTLICLPFARAVESTIEPALPVPVDPEVEDWVDVDDCESTTGWTLESNGGSPSGPTDAGTFINADAFIDGPGDYLRLIRTGSIAVPAGYYLALDVAISVDYLTTGAWRAYINGVWHTPIAVTPGLGEDDSTRLFFGNVGTISSFKVAFDFASVPIATTAVLSVHNVAYTDTIGAASTTTHRQQSRLVDVLGAAPTQAALRLYDATPADLGEDILIYTTRSDVPPNLRQYIDTSEAPAADATLISGAKHSLAVPTVFLIPASLLRPGSYALLANIDGGLSSHTLTWQARMTTLGGAALVGSDLVMSGSVEVDSGGFQVQVLATLVLPVVEVEGSNYAVELTLTGHSETVLDEAWLFSLDDGVLTWVRDFEGLDWIEIRSPELGAARPSVWGGRNLVGTGASCIDWKCLSFGPHRFDPGQMQIFTVTPASLKSQCEIEFFPRGPWHVRGEETA